MDGLVYITHPNMKRILISFFFGTIFLHAFSQVDSLQLKLDSIIKEADFLYCYEKAVWNASDILMVESPLKNNYGGYVVSHTNDTIFATFIDKTQKQKIATYYFTKSNLGLPFKTETGLLPLNHSDQELLEIKSTVLSQLSDKKYQVAIPQNFNPNFVLIKEKVGFKLYLILGTSESGVIPFGNDYLFKTDSKGKITSWEKFHSRVIPTWAAYNGKKVTESIHSHLNTTPYITATDICTFRLYAPYTELDRFSVYSPAIKKTMTYILKTNQIVVEAFNGSILNK